MIHHKNLLSDKDLQLIKITYRTIIENYYDGPTEENSHKIVVLNDLTMQSISTSQQSDTILLVSVLEVLKLKAKSNRELSQSIQSLIIHLKNPLKIKLKEETLENALDIIQIYPLGCMVISRFFQTQLKGNSSYDWKKLICKISQNCDKNMQIGVEVLNLILPHYQGFAKDVSKSGLIKYICLVYILQVLNQKNHLYKALKILKIVALNDRTVLMGRQKNMATVIYTHSRYIITLRQIAELCYDQDYCTKLLSVKLDVDSIYVWSYHPTFCALTTKSTVHILEQMLDNKGISIEQQWKIYAILYNIAKTHPQYSIKKFSKIPKHAQKNLNIFLKLAIASTQNDERNFQTLDLKAIEYIYDKSNISDAVTVQLIKQLKNLDPTLKHKKIGHIPSSMMDNFSFEKNPQYFMENAMKIPKNKQQAKVITQILDHKIKNTQEFQNDMIETVKSKALDSLRQSIIQRRNINFPNIVNNLNLDANNNPKDLDKLLKMIELYLTMNPDDASLFDKNKFLKILEHLENNYSSQIIDWVAAGQGLSYLFGPDQWKKHIQQIPDRCFWLLNAQNSEQNDKLLKILNSLPPKHPKIPIIIGYISKSGDQTLKRLLFEKTKLIDQATQNVANNSIQSSVFRSSISKVGDKEQQNKFDNYNKNVVNLAYFVNNWKDSENSKQVQSKIIKPVLDNIYKCFHGSEQELKFLQNSLPYKIDIGRLKDMNAGKLLQKNGKLVSYLHNNKYPGKIDYSVIQGLQNETDPNKITSVLDFLSQNPSLIQNQQLKNLIQVYSESTKDNRKYWKMFPHYIGILRSLLDVVCHPESPFQHEDLAQVFEEIIKNISENSEITPQQLDQINQAIYDALKKLVDNQVSFDVNKIKRACEKIQSQEHRKKIIQLLKNAKAKETIKLQQDKEQIPSEFKGNKYQNVQKASKQNKSLSMAKSPQVMIKGEKNQVFQDVSIDTNQILHKQEQNKINNTTQDLKLLDALKILKKIIKKEQPKTIFPKLVDIFMNSQFNRNRRYILGHMLTEYYQIIEKDDAVIKLLQLKDKTNLSREICYNFLNKFQEVFVIAKRWKLSGKQFLDLAITRIQCQSANKCICVQNGCEVAQYNLLKAADLNYFQNKKMHLIVSNLSNKIQTKGQAIYYMMLIGTSARLQNVKVQYIHKKIHCFIIQYLKNKEWADDPKIIANLSYALSSLCYTQNHIAVQIVKKKPQMLTLLSAYDHFSTQKIVIESGCSLLSNVCYSNKQTKQMLYEYGVIPILIGFLKKNLNKPEISTYKQIIRAIGNTSLHAKSAQKLLDSQISVSIVEMIQKFNILLVRDQQKLKVLKLTIDLISNLTTHKYKLQKMHEQGVTDLVITLLQTTEISQDHVMMGCVDTVDGLCQLPLVQNYVVMDKNLPYLLIDLLKVKQDQKLLTKTIRLLTNMTINQICIPYILNANLLSVLANIVIPVHQNQKIKAYVSKILVRIFNNKPDIKLILKSGYLDCVMKSIQISKNIDDYYIDIILYYSKSIPSYLNNKAFMNLVRLLTSKPHIKDVVQKCLKVFKIIFSSDQRSDDDVLIEGSPQMYEQILNLNQQNFSDILYVVGLHCIKSPKFKSNLKLLHQQKKCDLLNIVFRASQIQTTRDLGLSVLFCILNDENCFSKIGFGKNILKQEDMAFKYLSKGVKCKLYRSDGSCKSAIVDLTNDYVIRAYKYPDGQIKKKYTVSIRQIKDCQFMFKTTDDVWKNSVFVKAKGAIFQTEADINNCVTILGKRQWGQFTFLNLQFDTHQHSVDFIQTLSAIIMTFKMVS